METDQERWSLFVEGVGLVFRSWTALQMAVENGWGGSRSADKAEEMIEDTLYWFTLTKNGENLFCLVFMDRVSVRSGYLCAAGSVTGCNAGGFQYTN